MKPSDLYEALKVLIAARQPFHIWGDPGIGKSQVTMQAADAVFAKDYGYTAQPGGRCINEKTGDVLEPWHKRPWFIDFRACLREPTDMLGFPHINAKTGMTEYSTPAFLPKKGTSGLLFFDELNRAVEMMQNACLQPIQDRKIGEHYYLPEGWATGAAGNYETDAGVNRMSDALASRFTHLDAEADPVDFVEYAASADFHEAVVAWGRFRPDLVHVYERKRSGRSGEKRGFPCPRTYEFVSRILKEGCPNRTVEYALIKGSIGEAVGTEFIAFLQMFRDVPDIEEIIERPDTAPIPEKPATLYAISAALARRMTTTNIAKIVRYLDRLAAQEYAVFAMRDAVTRDPKLKLTPAFTRWGVAHPGLLL